MGVPDRRRPATAALPRRRYLPAVAGASHTIGSGESVAIALQRITTRQFTEAIDALADPHGELGTRVHIALARLGRIAALLRLVRPSIGVETCAAEIGVVRDISSLLVRLVDGADEIRSLDELRSRYDAALRPEVLDELRDQLLERHQLARLEQLPALRSGGTLDHAVPQLQRARARFAAWPVDGPMHGQHPVPDSFDAFADGLERTYRKGRACAAAGRGSGKWQRHAGDLAHQVELVSAAWPVGLAGTVATATDLAEVLAEHRRIGALETAVSSGTVAVDEVTAAVVGSLCVHERGELMAVAGLLATRLYAETPTAFVERLATYWSTRDPYR